MRTKCTLRVAVFLLAIWPLISPAPAGAQPSTGIGIKWQVKSRFRLFKNEEDFEYMVRFHGHDGVLADETALADATKGAGWAAQMVTRLCVNNNGGLQDHCRREYAGADHPGADEPYIVPQSHSIGVTAQGAPAGALCTWEFVAVGDESHPVIKPDQPCSDEVLTQAPYGKITHVYLFVGGHPDNSQPTATTDVAVRDLLIAGIGDSTAAGEGNPDRAIALDSDGFCFRRFETSERDWYYRPSRRGFTGSRACGSEPAEAIMWAKLGATWMDRACHRSLYSYQIRLALTIAIENPQLAVTYIPLGCTGATIEAGMLHPQTARESDCVPGANPGECSNLVGAQIDALRRILDAAHRRDKNRNLDLVLLTVGANDIDFSGLVANVMIDHASREFGIFSEAGRISSLEAARTALQNLPAEFARLRAQLKRLMGDTLEHVVYVSYGHPALYNNGQPCPQTRQGFDVHPAFTMSGALLRETSDFVIGDFLPRLKAIATCDRGGGCSADRDRMTFVDDHQAQFGNHGFCAQAPTDPAFDRTCFRADGTSFRSDQIEAPNNPLACSMLAPAFRAYAPRQRWVRTANDSYFAAMTYPDIATLPLQPDDIHDPLWGAASAVYGGAMHPTAQGYAAMADAALPAARRLLGLPAP
jgi:lysophospholipase L1-like esterase